MIHSVKTHEVALGTLELAAAQAVSNAYHNAANTQQQINTIGQAALTQGLMTFFEVFAVIAGKKDQNIDFQKIKPTLRSLTDTAEAQPKR